MAKRARTERPHHLSVGLILGLMVGLLAIVASASGCRRGGSADERAAQPTAERGDPRDDVAAPVVTREAKDLLFSYVDPHGNIQAVARVDDVPDAVKPRVLVIDLSKSPEERQAHRTVFFADLTREREDGTFAVTAQSRYDAADPSQAAAGFLPPVQDGAVVLYSAVWCGFCKKAKAWLQQHDVRFVERDVERTPGAQKELAGKLKAAGVRGGGIPVIDWSGTLVMGFDQRKLEELLKAAAK